MNKDLLILALETLREQVECGTCWECEVETLEGMSRLDMIDEEIKLLKTSFISDALWCPRNSNK